MPVKPSGQYTPPSEKDTSIPPHPKIVSYQPRPSVFHHHARREPIARGFLLSLPHHTAQRRPTSNVALTGHISHNPPVDRRRVSGLNGGDTRDSLNQPPTARTACRLAELPRMCGIGGKTCPKFERPPTANPCVYFLAGAFIGSAVISSLRHGKAGRCCAKRKKTDRGHSTPPSPERSPENRALTAKNFDGRQRKYYRRDFNAVPSQADRTYGECFV